MKNRPVQYFSKEYLEQCKLMTPDQIIEFVENFRKLMSFQKKAHPAKAEQKKTSTTGECNLNNRSDFPK